MGGQRSNDRMRERDMEIKQNAESKLANRRASIRERSRKCHTSALKYERCAGYGGGRPL